MPPQKDKSVAASARQSRKANKPTPAAKFAFITVDPNASEFDNEETLRKVRSHVTRHHYQNVREAEQLSRTSQSPSASPGPSPPRSDHLRLNTTQAEDARRARNAKKQAARAKKRADSGTAVVASPGAVSLSDSYGSSPSSDSNASSPPTPIHEFELHPSRLDPFDVLPVQGDITVDRTLQIFSVPEVRLMAPNLMPHSGVNSWGRLAGQTKAWRYDLGIQEDDELLFAERLYFASSLLDQLRGNGQTLETFKYQGSVIKLLQNKISMCGDAASVETVLAIIAMAVVSTLQGDFAQAKMHSDIAWRFIVLRGGLISFNLPVRRIITWSDAVVRSAEGEEVPWSWDITIDNACEPPPSDLANEAARLQEVTIQRLPPGIDLPMAVIYRLHILGLVSSRAWSHYDDHPAIHNIFFCVVHQLSELSAQEAKTPIVSTKSGAVIRRCLAMASQIFMRCTLGHTFDNQATRRRIARLRQALIANSEGISIWYRQGAADALLWILFIAIKAFPHSVPDHPWFVDQAGPVLDMLCLDKQSFESLIRSFPYTDKLGLNACEIVYDKVRAHQAQTRFSGLNVSTTYS